ncbi:MAG: alpha/beta hydrolase [Clostridia bacterium]|nr:alpha/beta hydrolase [Clostridia bacterium]
MWIFACIMTFVVFFAAGVASKFLLKPAWQKQYSVQWSDALGTLKTDLPYGEGKANKFDLYLPKDNTKEHYGLAVYLHAGGFTSGDKAEDQQMLAWLCKKGYVAAGINYTLRSNTNTASVLSQSNEIKAAIPFVVKAAEEAGYPIDKMAIAGGSAGHALAMIYAYRDAKEAPVPVVFTFGAVGPSSFYAEDWGVLGGGVETEQQRQAAAALFTAMSGEVITPEQIADGSYLEKMKPIAAAEWVSENPIPTVAAYGTRDRVQPFLASLRLKKALEDNHVDHVYLELPHSGHGLQNDNALSKQWMESIEAYLAKYLPVE